MSTSSFLRTLTSFLFMSWYQVNFYCLSLCFNARSSGGIISTGELVSIINFFFVPFTLIVAVHCFCLFSLVLISSLRFFCCLSHSLIRSEVKLFFGEFFYCPLTNIFLFASSCVMAFLSALLIFDFNPGQLCIGIQLDALQILIVVFQ